MTGSSTPPAIAARSDPLTLAERSERMSRVRSKDSKAEWAVRRLVHGLGYRYRLHSRMLPGRPDLVFPGRRKVIFVHGCFWHWHQPCTQYRLPITRTEFWLKKLGDNRQRDQRHLSELQAQGWDALVVWECELRVRDRAHLTAKIREFLDGEGK